MGVSEQQSPAPTGEVFPQINSDHFTPDSELNTCIHSLALNLVTSINKDPEISGQVNAFSQGSLDDLAILLTSASKNECIYYYNRRSEKHFPHQYLILDHENKFCCIRLSPLCRLTGLGFGIFRDDLSEPEIRLLIDGGENANLKFCVGSWQISNNRSYEDPAYQSIIFPRVIEFKAEIEEE